jgi:hypothetical protein
MTLLKIPPIKAYQEASTAVYVLGGVFVGKRRAVQERDIPLHTLRRGNNFNPLVVPPGGMDGFPHFYFKPSPSTRQWRTPPANIYFLLRSAASGVCPFVAHRALKPIMLQ